MFGKWTETYYHTALWNINYVGHEAQDEHQKTSQLLVGLEQVTKPKTL